MSWYLPEGQCSQFVLPVHCWYLPFSHSTHACVLFFLCASVLKWPMGQTEQLDEAFTENCPGVQRLHSGAFVVLEK